MKDFTKGYFMMSESDAIDYAKLHIDAFKNVEKLECSEIGDGNLNYVFKIVNPETTESIIIKQAGPVARISDEFKVSPDRNRIEFEILQLQHELAGFVPEVYNYDPVMNCTIMEDLSDYQIMRTALLQHKTFPDFADHISTFLVNTLLMTSDIVMNHQEKKALVKNFINPELCEISEDLVFTEPFYNCSRNDVTPGMEAFVSDKIWNDEALLSETAKLKFEFMTNAQSLIHGDLHTGSIFIKEGSTKVFDPEFAFYGPAGYDIGNIVANLLFAFVNGQAMIENVAQKAAFTSFIKTSIKDLINLFNRKFNHQWEQSATEKVACYPGFKSFYLNSIIQYTAGIAGCELIRRIIGLAHVKDITTIEGRDARLNAEKFCLSVGKLFILNRTTIFTGEDFIKIIEEAEEAIYG